MKILQKNKILNYFSLLLLGLCLMGCGTTQQSNFYQFDESVSPSLTGIEQGHVIGVGPLQLPEYLNRPQIVTRNSAYHLNISEYHRWVEPLNDSITRMLVKNLSNNLHSNRVYWIPRQDRHFPLDLRVVIDIGRFDGQLGKEISLESRWSLFNKQDKPILTRVSLIKEVVDGPDYESLVIAMSKALKALGSEISEASRSFLEASK